MQLAEAKKKADDTQLEVEETQGAKRKLDKDFQDLQDRIEVLTAENVKVARSKKKVQEEVRKWEEMWAWLRVLGPVAG